MHKHMKFALNLNACSYLNSCRSIWTRIMKEVKTPACVSLYSSVSNANDAYNHQHINTYSFANWFMVRYTSANCPNLSAIRKYSPFNWFLRVFSTVFVRLDEPILVWWIDICPDTLLISVLIRSSRVCKSTSLIVIVWVSFLSLAPEVLGNTSALDTLWSWTCGIVLIFPRHLCQAKLFIIDHTLYRDRRYRRLRGWYFPAATYQARTTRSRLNQCTLSGKNLLFSHAQAGWQPFILLNRDISRSMQSNHQSQDSQRE